ncbi:hypothetical protein F2Q70_00015535 [Brassica cretica]|uniref:Uncharacterized protein n=1 Tax=Brassica cretica TaxID=69181 RepID=A0A8S9HW68_BRACR|nr:hypothetical protein F2Q70_00015535 [Brassica cretica]
MVLIFHSFKGFSDDFWDDLPVSHLKYNALEDFEDDLPGSLLTESSHMSPFHNRYGRFGKFLCLIFLHLVFNQKVLIFHLDMFFKSGVDFGRFMGSLLGSLLKYNAVEVF